jgi:hypothetical protein
VAQMNAFLAQIDIGREIKVNFKYHSEIIIDDWIK